MREELEKWWGSVLEVTPDDIKSDTVKVVFDKDIERLLQSVFEKINWIIGKDDELEDIVFGQSKHVVNQYAKARNNLRKYQRLKLDRLKAKYKSIK